MVRAIQLNAMRNSLKNTDEGKRKYIKGYTSRFMEVMIR